MKYLVSSIILLLVTMQGFSQSKNMNMNNDNNISISPYDMNENDEKLFEDMGLPEDWLCKTHLCPEKYKAQGMNVFLMPTEKLSSDVYIHISSVVKKKLQKNKKLYGFYYNGVFAIYHKDKGFRRNVDGIRVLRGDS